MNNNNEGKIMYEFIKKIFPYCRSITGEGVRKTLSDIHDFIEADSDLKLNIRNVASGTQVFDWNVPKEWVIRDAFIEDENQNHIIDMKDNNLHVVGYSTPVDMWVTLDELKQYIYTQPNQPDVIPYVTSYYKERFGFCMSQNQLNSLQEGKYHMLIDSGFIDDGTLNYAEIYIPGKTKKEVFFSTYICHPSMANNECSGPALSSMLAKYVNDLKDRKYSYRFIFIPETIGALTYLSQNNHLEEMKKNVIAGFNLTCVGDNNAYSMVETRDGNTFADKLLKNILSFHTSNNYKEYSFLYRGSDERQYNSPGVDLPCVCFCRSKFHEYPEYHTSADNLDYISVEGLQGSYDVMTQAINAIEFNDKYKIKVIGEPQLGKRGLYPTISQKGATDSVKTLINFIAYADGKRDLIDISNRINASIVELIPIVKKLKENDLLGDSL